MKKLNQRIERNDYFLIEERKEDIIETQPASNRVKTSTKISLTPCISDETIKTIEELQQDNKKQQSSIRNMMGKSGDEAILKQIASINNSTEHVRQFVDHMNQSMAPFRKEFARSSEHLADSFKNLNSLASDITRAMGKIDLSGIKLIDSGAIAHSFELFREIAIELTESISEENRDRNEYGKSRLHQWSQFGWVPTEGLMTIFQSRFFVPETQEEADKQIMDIIEGETSLLLDELKKDQEEDDYIFRNAIGCYEHELYYAAGLSIFSGIEREMQSYKHAGINTGSAFLRNFVKKMTLDEENAYFQLTESLTNIFDDLYASFDRPQKNGNRIAAPDALNRNRMDHGASRDLDKVDVVKLFFFWTCFANFLNEVLKKDSE